MTKAVNDYSANIAVCKWLKKNGTFGIIICGLTELFEDMGPVTSDVKIIQHSTIRAWYQRSNVVVAVLLCCFRIWMTCYNCWNHEIWSLPGNPEGEYSTIFKCSRIVQQENNHKHKSMSTVPLHGSKEIKWRF